MKEPVVQHKDREEYLTLFTMFCLIQSTFPHCFFFLTRAGWVYLGQIDILFHMSDKLRPKEDKWLVWSSRKFRVERGIQEKSPKSQPGAFSNTAHHAAVLGKRECALVLRSLNWEGSWETVLLASGILINHFQIVMNLCKTQLPGKCMHLTPVLTYKFKGLLEAILQIWSWVPLLGCT